MLCLTEHNFCITCKPGRAEGATHYSTLGPINKDQQEIPADCSLLWWLVVGLTTTAMDSLLSENEKSHKTAL